MAEQFDLLAGLERKENGIARVAQNSSEWVKAMRDEALRIIDYHGSVTTDYLRAYAKSNNMIPHHPNAWGAIFRHPMFKVIGYQKSKYVTNNARRICVWTTIDHG